MTETTPAEPACQFTQGCHRVVACEPSCAVSSARMHEQLAAATVPASAPTDRAAVAARLWAVAEHNIVAEWICCEPINPEHDLCVQGDATRRMVKALLVDDPEAIRPAPLLDAVLTAPAACSDPIECSHEAALGEAEAATEAYRLALSQALGLGTGANWEALRDRGRDLVAEVAELTRAVRRPGGREQAPADQAALPVRPQTLAAIARHLEARAVTILRPDSETYAEYHAVAAELRRLADAASGPGRADGETQQDQTQARRGDLFEAWLKTQRDQHDSDGTGDHEMYDALDNLLDEYRLYADTGTPLREHVCEARAVGDCDCLEQPAAVSQPGKEA